MASYQKAEADTSATRQIRSESGSVLVEEEEQETRFRKASFEEHRIVFDQLLSIICAYFLILGIRALVLQSPQTYGNLDIYHASCRLSAASACLLLKLMYRIPRLQEFLGTNRNKDNVLTLWIILLMQLELAQRAVGDLKRSRSPHHVSPHVKLEVEFKQGFPWRWSCTDSDPILSIWNHHSEVSHEDAGCVSRMVSADALAIYTVMGTLLSVSANVDGRAAVLISLGQGMSMIVACLMAGIKRESMIATVILHLVTSLCSAYLRNERFEASRNCFLRDYGLEASREKAHELMSSIIPKNLHARLKESNPLDLVGSNMEQCTIMFLSLAPDVLKDKKDITMEDFDLIDEIFSDFDAIVEFYGMFKYHHIQDSYVIACPRSACPFRVPSNRKSYQDLSMVRMIQLAHSLLERARMHRSTSGKQLWAKVGLSVGPATGAVVSCHRRFYCLFGDVINTSARMCAYSEPGQIHCTAEVVNILSNIKHDTIKIISRGELPIKGKGVMETFFLQINEEPYFEPEMITMCSSRRLSRRGDESDSVLRTSSMSSSSCSASVSSLRSSNSGQKAENTSKTSNIWREFLDEDECGGIFCVGYEVSQKWSSFLDRKVENEFLETNCLITFRCLVMGQTCNAVVSIITLHSLLQLDILKDERSIVQRKLVMMICLLHIFVQLHYLARCLTAYWRNVANQFRCCPAVKSGSCSISSILCYWYKTILLTQWCFWIFTMLSSLLCNATGQALIFNSVYSYCNLLLISANVKDYVTFAACSIAFSILHMVFFWQQIACLMLLILFVMAYVCGSYLKLESAQERMNWMTTQATKAQYRFILKTLNDLFPEDIAKEILYTGSILSKHRRAVVLHLDLCNYTELVASMDPDEVAKLVHALFSNFDSFVTEEEGVFKMDTIGDAYVCAGWVGESERMACERMLHLAGKILRSVSSSDLRGNSGGLECRIGIAMGNCVAGVMGRLQPRYHVMGEAIMAAQLAESSAVHQSIHLSRKVCEALGIESDTVFAPELEDN